MIIRTIPYQVDTEFEKHKSDVFSQKGEDGLITYFLEKMKTNSGYFVEFGAWDGKHLSNCANLAQKNWNGCFIEGDHSRYLDLVENYKNDEKISTINRLVSPKGDNSLDSILKNINAPKMIDVLSIDIDGYDYAIWKSLTLFNAKLVIIEFNPTIPSNVIVIQDNDSEKCFGNSLAALWELGKEKGYELVGTTDWNALFIPKSDCEKFNITPYTPWELKNTEYETYFFHGYNGEIKLAGNKSMIWHGIPIDENKLQILPKQLQKIPVSQSTEYFSELEQFKNKLNKANQIK